jgi:pimeloyl-ACP methyl ester carboxylesterase
MSEIRAPVWVVHGDEDQLVPLRVADELGALLPTSTVTKLSRVGHAPHLEKPDVVLGAIRDALRA